MGSAWSLNFLKELYGPKADAQLRCAWWSQSQIRSSYLQQISQMDIQNIHYFLLSNNHNNFNYAYSILKTSDKFTSAHLINIIVSEFIAWLILIPNYLTRFF